MADLLNPIADVGGILAGGAETISGAVNLKRDKAALSALHAPFFRVQDEYYQNKNITQSEAGQGYTSAAKDYLTSESQKGLGTSLSALTQSGASPNDISKLFGVFRNSINNTAAQDSEMQMKNIKYFMDANKDLAAQKTTQWAINEEKPYEQQLKQITERIAADKSNIWGGVGTALGSTSALGTSLSNNKLINKLFGNKAAGGAVADPFQGMTATDVPIDSGLPTYGGNI